jgi:hypothetical protein
MMEILVFCLLLTAHIDLSISGLTELRGKVIAELKKHFHLKTVLLLNAVSNHNSSNSVTLLQNICSAQKIYKLCMTSLF